MHRYPFSLQTSRIGLNHCWPGNHESFLSYFAVPSASLILLSIFLFILISSHITESKPRRKRGGGGKEEGTRTWCEVLPVAEFRDVDSNYLKCGFIQFPFPLSGGAPVRRNASRKDLVPASRPLRHPLRRNVDDLFRSSHNRPRDTLGHFYRPQFIYW